MRVFIWLSWLLDCNPEACLNRSKRRIHLGQLSGCENVNASSPVQLLSNSDQSSLLIDGKYVCIILYKIVINIIRYVSALGPEPTTIIHRVAEFPVLPCRKTTGRLYGNGRNLSLTW